MGQEIDRIQFQAEDFTRFARRLREETQGLAEYLQAGRFCNHGPCMAGVEIEAWLLDPHGFPVADNEHFLAELAEPLVVPELARFNIELNCKPHPLEKRVFHALETDLLALWQRCQHLAHAQGHTLLLIGILPTLRESDLSLANVSSLNRYRALNDQVMRLRNGQPVRLDIRGRDHLQLEHGDVMLEAGTTSFQLHVQMPVSRAARYYNAAQLLAAPMVAVAANAPTLFGHDLWAETRVPLFEQAVDGAHCAPQRARVTFGNDWLRDTPMQLFNDNLQHFAPLLPLNCDDTSGRFAHVCLHNGTIWRWNRLLLGEDETGCPHVRLEHRVMPAGPSFIDMLANAALFYGVIHALAHADRALESMLEFAVAKANFYTAARDGLDAQIAWPGLSTRTVRDLVLQTLLPLAQAGLHAQGVDLADAERLLDIIRLRAETGQTGAVWQRRYLARYPGDFVGLTQCYLEHQRQGNPVHEWEIS